ncbi:putative sis1 heat shock protein [Paramyrothecium foliicola]|nr:putative sis1 heat shock protein [Paramyrothecium foliicola]
MASAAPPNYYAILGVTENATTQQIRDAYKRAALKTHPDRVSNDSPERSERTRKFQLVNDAYFTLSDPTRRRDYDAQRNLFGKPSAQPADPFEEADEEVPPQAGTGGPSAYSWAWNFFTNNASGRSAPADHEQTQNEQFSDVFEEMMREEGMAEEGTNQPTGKFWGMIGGVSGGALGFIVANVPGLVAGAVAGNRLGAIRDTKGKSVYSVFQELPADDKARLLSQLAAKVFSHAVGSG